MLLLLLLLFFCLSIIQIATLLGWILWVSSASHTLGFPSWVLECFQLFKSTGWAQGDLGTLLSIPSIDPSLGVGEAEGSQGDPGTTGPKDQPLLPQNGRGVQEEERKPEEMEALSPDRPGDRRRRDSDR